MARKPVSHELIGGPYRTPLVEIGDELFCSIRGQMTVGFFSDGRIPWPRSKELGNSYILCDDLERAVQVESVAAIRHWWGPGAATVTKWRKALEVKQFNLGTHRLHSSRIHQVSKTIEIDHAVLQAQRLRCSLTLVEMARRMGWASSCTCIQYESGRRRRVRADTLKRLAKVLKCRPKTLCRKS